MTPIKVDRSDARVDQGKAARMIEATLTEGAGEIAVRAVGPDAEKAAEVLRALFDGPKPSALEWLTATGDRVVKTTETIERERGRPSCE